MPSAVSELIGQATIARRQDRHADAFEILLEAVALCRETEDARALVLALKGFGQLQRDLGQIEESRQCYTAAVALCRRLGDPLLLAHTLRHLGDLHRESRSPASAQVLCAEALAIYRQHSSTHPLDLANALRSLALLEGESGSAAAARSHWQEAMHLYAAIGVPDGVAECTSRLSLLGGDLV